MPETPLPGTEPTADEGPVLVGADAFVAVLLGIATECLKTGLIYRGDDEVAPLVAADAVLDLVRACLPVVASGFEVTRDRLKRGAVAEPEDEEEVTT